MTDIAASSNFVFALIVDRVMPKHTNWLVSCQCYETRHLSGIGCAPSNGAFTGSHSSDERTYLAVTTAIAIAMIVVPIAASIAVVVAMVSMIAVIVDALAAAVMAPVGNDETSGERGETDEQQ
jgi:hypothetical protein